MLIKAISQNSLKDLIRNEGVELTDSTAANSARTLEVTHWTMVMP